ncbi:hypothetical protein AOLI_G00050220 [Acnodon oligacanthus]
MDGDVAVVGIGCSFPGGEGLDNFWKVLVNGRNCAVEIPEDRFDLTHWYDPDDNILGKTQTTKAAFIEGFNEFDHKFFGISEDEANFMDPQQKLLLQCSYRALEDSGIPLEKISGSRTGVYIGLMNRDYETLLNNSPSTITHFNGTGTAMSIAANRISYTFNLTGPSFTIDSACSSSSVALHSACQAIRQDDCEMALCGGALHDFDHIWGIICKTAVNQDGHAVSPMTKPSMVQQMELLNRIYSAETYLSDVQYVEAHGTGTPVGDPIEAGSISKVIAKARPAGLGPLCIGSVKGNIGHTESAAGVAGLIKVAIANLLKHWGIRPVAVLGHSIGEVAAAHCSGLLSLEDAVKVMYYRSVLQSKVTGGKMLVVGNIAVSDILKILPDYTGKVCLAAVNSPVSCVLSGDKDAVESVYQILKSSVQGKNLFLHVLEVPAAYHSHMMDPILSQIKDSIGSLSQHEMECELFSTVTGKTCSLGDFVSGDYWARNIRNPVAFEQAVKALGSNEKNVVFVEIGPRRALQRNIVETLGNDTVVLSSVQPDKDHEAILIAVSKLFELGVNVNWDHFYNGFESPPASYPRYQFDCLKKEVHFEEVRQGNEVVAHCSHPLIIPHKHDNRLMKCNLSAEVTPFIWEHRSNGIVIAPGALYVELAFASVMETLVPKMPLSSLQLTIDLQTLLVLSKSFHFLKVQLEPSENKVLFQIQSSAAVHASGSITYTTGPAVTEHHEIDLDVILKRCSLVITREQVYTTLNQAGFEYGPTFQQLGNIHYGEEFKEAVATVKIPDELLKQLYEYNLHPAVLDYFLQMTSVLGLNNRTTRRGFPSAIGSTVISAPLCKDMVIYMRVSQEMLEYFEVCGCFTDKKGHILIELKDVRITFLGEDYFPVTISDLKFGQKIYWHKRASSQNHKLLALDFSGIVTAVGKDVRKLKVGDHVVSCYPTAATSKVVLPESACYKTKKLQFLKDIPCVSYFVLAWEILSSALPKAKPKKTLGIFSAVPDSALMKVLSFTANKSGWNVVKQSELTGLIQNVDQCPVFVLLPPYEQSWMAQLGSVASASHIFLVCDNKDLSSVLQSDSESTCFHFLKLRNIIQKSHLKTQKAHIYRWLKMMNLDRTWLSLHSNTFQVTEAETTSHQYTDVRSYFSTKTVSVIVLDNGGSIAGVTYINLQPKPKQLFASNGVYVVSGGLSGLGLETVKFISNWGGRYIATLSRNAPSEETQLQICSLKRRYGVRIITLQCDVSVSDQVLKAITVIGEKFPSCAIKGIFHSAAVLHDGLLETLDKSLFEKVLRPKVSGALNLHYASLNSKVDYFVCYSSISSFIGNASQANYAAANSFLDSLCHYRRNVGLAGQSINWGPLKLGLLLNKEDFQKFLEAKGLMIMEVPEIHEALKHCLMENKPQQVVCRFNFRNLRNNVLSQNASLKVRLTALIEKELESKIENEPRKDVQSSFDNYTLLILVDFSGHSTAHVKEC